MKRIVFIVLLAVFATSLSAQKAVRKSIRKGNKAFKEQRYSAAETDYSKAMEGDASSKEASFNLANTYYKQHRYDEAIEEYKHYLTLESEAPEKMSAAWSNMGNTFLKKKAGEKSQMMAQAQAGNAQQQQQQVDNLKMSMEAYKNALRLNPQDDETRENLAIVQKMIKDQEGGEGEDNKDDQNEDKKEDKEDKKEEPKKDEQKDQQQQNENQMSEQNMQQILEAIEQDERETQERVNQLKAEERKKKNERNRQQDKDW